MSDLYSDNGTNFVGANSILNEINSTLALPTAQTTIINYFSAQKISWHFFPEKTIHFRGLWQATVKSTKFHLRRVIGDQKLTFEELSTVLCQVECCLNSRPLVPFHFHAEDGINILISGHFLVGCHMQALPKFNFTQQKILQLHRWSLCQTIAQHFWKRWSAEYLQHLQHFSKCKSSSTNLQVDYLVLIKDDSPVTVTRWPMGCVLSVSSGIDCLLQIQTKLGIYKWLIAKLVQLLPQSWKKELPFRWVACLGSSTPIYQFTTYYFYTPPLSLS